MKNQEKAQRPADWLQQYDEWLTAYAQENKFITVGEAIDILEAAQSRQEGSGSVFDQMHPRFWLGDSEYSPILRLSDDSHDIQTTSTYAEEQTGFTGPEGAERITKMAAGTRRSFARLSPNAPMSLSTFRALRLWISSLSADQIGLQEDSKAQRVNLDKLLSCAQEDGIAVPEPLRKLAAESSVPQVDSGGNPIPLTNTDGWLRVKEAADEAGVASSSITEACDKGRLQTNGLSGRKRRISPASLKAYMAGRDDQYYLGR